MSIRSSFAVTLYQLVPNRLKVSPRQEGQPSLPETFTSTAIWEPKDRLFICPLGSYTQLISQPINRQDPPESIFILPHIFDHDFTAVSLDSSGCHSSCQGYSNFSSPLSSSYYFRPNVLVVRTNYFIRPRVQQDSRILWDIICSHRPNDYIAKVYNFCGELHHCY